MAAMFPVHTNTVPGHGMLLLSTLSNWVPDFGANIDITFFKGTELKEMKNKTKKYYKKNIESGLLTSECKLKKFC